MTSARAEALDVLRTLVGRDDADFHDLTGKSLFDVTITVNGPAGAAP